MRTPDSLKDITQRRSTQHLLLIIIVAGVAVAGSLISGVGFGLFVGTLAVVATSLWISYGSTTGVEATTAEAPRQIDVRRLVPSVAIPKISTPSISFDRAQVASPSLVATIGSVLAIVLLGGFLFTSNLDSNPAGFFADEAEIGLESLNLLHWDAHTTRIPFFYHHLEYDHLGTLTLFATAPFVGIFGLDDFSVRWASAFWTIAAAIAIYFTLRRLKVPFAVVPVLVTLASPLVILVSRVNFGHAPSLFMMSTGYFLWVIARQKQRLGLAFLAGVIIALSAYGQSSYYVAVPLFLMAIAITEILFNRLNWRSYLPMLFAGAGALLAIFPVPYKALTDDQFLDRYRDKSTVSSSGLDRLESSLHLYPDYFRFDMLFKHGDGGWLTRHSIPGAPWFFRSLLLFMIIGLVSLLAVRGDSNKRFFVPMAILLLLYPIPDLLTRSPSDAPYSYSLVWGVIAIPFLVGYGIVGIERLAASIHGKPGLGPLAYAGAALAVSLWSLVGFWNGAFADYPQVSADYWGWQYGPKPISEYFKAHAGEYDQYIMSGDFNGAYVFVPFFMHGSALEPLTISGGLGEIDLTKRQLLALRKDEWDRYKGSQFPVKSYLEVVDVINYPNGQPAFYLLRVRPELLDLDEAVAETPAG